MTIFFGLNQYNNNELSEKMTNTHGFKENSFKIIIIFQFSL